MIRVRNSWVVARREFLEKIRSKGFWIATVALPVLILAMGILPALLMAPDSAHRLAIVDGADGLGAEVAARLRGPSAAGSSLEGLGQFAPFEVEVLTPRGDREALRAELDRRVLSDDIDAWVWIDPESLESDRIPYHAESVSNFLVQERLARVLSSVVRQLRLEGAGYDAEEIDRLARGVDLVTVRVSEKGSREEGAEAGIILAYVLFFLLYTILLIYGQQVMNAVLEEKSSRIVEVIVSTTRPFELMLGKLTGICLAALTQLGIWMGTLALVTLPGVVAAIAWIPDEVDVPTFGGGVLVHFLFHFLLGFFLFSTLYAAIGAAFNNVQEAQQFATFAVFFVIAPVLLFWKVLNDPDSTVAMVTSLIPPFTPLLMLLRIAVKAPPAWQIALGYALTAAFTLGMVWLSARVYRVGILMYGKKPTIKELWRWVRYA